ncbi:NAD(P)-binding protein [Aspergillus campestris IBT 28561]|uniref:NAD(P)-binding protein n=1 Tax=Aspergillus campestris (strain IBT 28561) TaxID=1392248 RepID=A0A2I1DHG6_ASPC2|nr:NAD(P)-binding protein [Aspergillus campestris IBT 28561]PKY09309.1 NAD(P)-binding protein [Aspergillus campestris IBT 28561]
MASGFAIVTPASRGLGFAFARQLLAQTNLPVVATARRDCDEVRSDLVNGITTSQKADERLHVFKVDVTDESAISSMVSNIRDVHPDTHLRLAITVPGTLHVEKTPSQIDYLKALDSFKTNSLAPMLLMKHLSPLLPTKSAAPFLDTPSSPSHPEDSLQLPTHAIYAMMAARVGSISDNATGGWYSYRASKAAVFQLAKTFDLHLRTRSRDRALAVAMHPGTVQTDFTRDYWEGRDMLQPHEAADRLLRVICAMGAGPDEGRGRCWDWKGEEVLP